MFSVVMLILKLLRCRFYIRIDQLAARCHLGNLLKNNCVMNCLMSILTPGKRSVVLAQHGRYCFIIFVFEIISNKNSRVLLICLFDLSFGQVGQED